MSSHHHQAPANITSARQAHSADIRARERKYLFSMGVRTACFLIAVFVVSGWLRWALIVAAFILPYIAVVIANAGNSKENARRPWFMRLTHRQIESQQNSSEQDESGQSSGPPPNP